MANKASKTSSFILSIATVILVLAFIVHVIGFSKRWVVVEDQLSALSYLYKVDISCHAGLWQHCGCEGSFSTTRPDCVFRSNDLRWFRFVQVAETLGLIGLKVSMILSLLMCFRRTRTCKHINIFLVILSGALILVGSIVFVLKTKEEFGRLSTLLDGKHEDNWRLGYGFILCTVASCLCLLVCAPLYVIDLCLHTPETSSEAPAHITIQPPPQDNVQDGHPAGYASVYYIGQPPPQGNVQCEQPPTPQGIVQGGHPAGYAPVNYAAQPPPQGNVQCEQPPTPQGIAQGGHPAGYAPVNYAAQPPLQGNMQGEQPAGYAPVYYIGQPPPQGNLQGEQPARYAPAYNIAQPPPQDSGEGGHPTEYGPVNVIAQPPPQGNVQCGQPARYAPVCYTAQQPPRGYVQGGQPTGYAPAFYTAQRPPQGYVQGGQLTGYAPLYYIAQPPPQGYVQGRQPAGYVRPSAPTLYSSTTGSDQPDDSKIPYNWRA